MLLHCSASGRIIEQTEKKLVIEGLGQTKYEASKVAKKKAKKIFPKHTVASEECNKQYHASGSTSTAGSYNNHLATYYSCVLVFKKK